MTKLTPRRLFFLLNEKTFKDAKLYRSYVRQAYFCNPVSKTHTQENFDRDYRELMESF